jgi:hypothetical protein
MWHQPGRSSSSSSRWTFERATLQQLDVEAHTAAVVVVVGSSSSSAPVCDSCLQFEQLCGACWPCFAVNSVT